jgi:hypothetical protein
LAHSFAACLVLACFGFGGLIDPIIFGSAVRYSCEIIVNELFPYTTYYCRPIITHSLMGLGSTLLNIYTVQHGYWSTVSKVTASVIGGWLFFASLIFVAYECTIWELKAYGNAVLRQYKIL